LVPILAWAQIPAGSVHGVIKSGFDRPANIRLFGVNPAHPATDVQADQAEKFQLQHIDPGWYILSVEQPEFYQFVQAVKVEPGQDNDLGTVAPTFDFCKVMGLCSGKSFTRGVSEPLPSPPPLVLTVCEALRDLERYNLDSVVIVGIFKSGLDETLREDCPNQLVTGDIGWMSAIALTRPTAPPDSLRDEIEKKRQIILNSGPPGAHPRPERVTALYGRLVSPSGLTSSPCCTAPAEINAAPARLLGLDERDFRVLR
jgi:hypothetical protein